MDQRSVEDVVMAVPVVFGDDGSILDVALLVAETLQCSFLLQQNTQHKENPTTVPNC